MERVFTGSASFRAPSGGTVVAVGNFDGVHAGHRALLAEARALAGAGVVVACTFDPAPTAVLAPERHQPRILRLPERVARLLAAGADAVVVEAFDRELANRPAAWFADEVLSRRLGAHTVVVGHDFCFGRGREGDAAWLRAQRPALRTVMVPALELDGAVVSSSRVRRLVAVGEVEVAAHLLGQPHRLEGRVVGGDRLGRVLGFPTANLACEVELLPADGVYAVRVDVGTTEDRARAEGGEGALRAVPGVMNIGVRPTFSGMERRVEVHLLEPPPPRGESGGWDLYGAWLSVAVVHRVRGEQRFASVDELVAQIGRDAAATRAWLAR